MFFFEYEGSTCDRTPHSTCPPHRAHNYTALQRPPPGGSASCRHVSALPAVHGSASPTFPPNRQPPPSGPRKSKGKRGWGFGVVGAIEFVRPRHVSHAIAGFSSMGTTAPNPIPTNERVRVLLGFSPFPPLSERDNYSLHSKINTILKPNT